MVLRDGQLFILFHTGQPTFWNVILYGAGNFFIRGTYGAANFLDGHFMRSLNVLNNIAEGPNLPVLLTYFLVIKFLQLVCKEGDFLDHHVLRGGKLFVDRKVDYSGPVFP